MLRSRRVHRPSLPLDALDPNTLAELKSPSTDDRVPIITAMSEFAAPELMAVRPRDASSSVAGSCTPVRDRCSSIA
eukprot:CAMPEP_0196750104 /NCGR_PEP_ID=MMETSP1091-20130531/79500_1 /TAXON_ID=302021 /ORGANISM="Rhodomonas sp., Strain CCMP768" /LENGTH=75 /DNA_ID=CAMNT_0042097681 /DNA_START=133 /DNA_END=356 /DNA_ORIENTATION=+